MSDDINDPTIYKKLDLRIAGKWRLERRIGGGSYGAVYIATTIETNEEVAIKLEHIRDYPLVLEDEAEIYKTLADGTGIPRIHAFVTECDYNCLVFDLLGPSLEDLFKFCGGKFTLKTVLMIADQLLSRLEFIHSKGILHRDVKPENCLMGTRRSGNVIYVTDMGLATQHRTGSPVTRAVAGQKPNLVGTARYASINGHLGVSQSRSDDLESLGYMLLYFLRCPLPWQGLKDTRKATKDERILKRKRSISIKDLCEGLPSEFVAYFEYIRSLSHDDEPNYAWLRKQFSDLFGREDFEYDNVYDWTVIKFMMAEQENEGSSGLTALVEQATLDSEADRSP